MKKILPFVFGAVIAASVIAAPFLAKKQAEGVENKVYKAIITIWQIDSFEGGSGSRAAFLKRVSADFNKKYNDVLTLVIARTVNGTAEALKNGELPDIISSGVCGFELKNAVKLKNYDIKDGGETKNGRYFVAWCKGGYFKIKKRGKTPVKTLIINGGNNLSEVAAALNGETNVEVTEKEEAYNEFLKNENIALIGTQRDIIRLMKKETDFEAEPVSVYNDLYQYAAVTAVSNEKRECAKLFLNYLLSEKIQKKLTDINMLSVTLGGLYPENEYYSALEKEKTEFALSPYTELSRIQTLKAAALDRLNGGENESEIINILKRL